MIDIEFDSKINFVFISHYWNQKNQVSISLLYDFMIFKIIYLSCITDEIFINHKYTHDKKYILMTKTSHYTTFEVVIYDF